MEEARLRLRVSPGSKQRGIVGRHGDAWKVAVSAPPEGGRANAAVVDLLADTVGVSRDAVAVVSGHGARDKIVALTGVDLDDAERRLTAAARR